MVELLAMLALNAVALGGLWLVYARTPYARRTRWVLRRLPVLWRVAPAGPPIRPPVEIVPAPAPPPATEADDADDPDEEPA